MSTVTGAQRMEDRYQAQALEAGAADLVGLCFNYL
jgi:hypothetical protein